MWWTAAIEVLYAARVLLRHSHNNNNMELLKVATGLGRNSHVEMVDLQDNCLQQL